MKRTPMFGLLAVLLAGLLFLHTRWSAAQDGPFGIYTYHGDNMRTGWNPHETVLTQEAVQSRRFGKIWTSKVDGKVYAQPHAHDGDLGSGGAMVIPDQPGTTTPRLLVGSGKDGAVRLLNRDHLGGFTDGTDRSKGDGAVQNLVDPIADVTKGAGGVYGGPAYWEGPEGRYLFCAALGHSLRRFRLGLNPDGSGRGWLVLDKAGNDFESAWATPVVSSNGRAAGTGIVWVLSSGPNTDPRGGLCAYSADDLTPLWNSNLHGYLGFDALAAPAMRFAVPIIANGKAYAATESSVVCYGLR